VESKTSKEGRFVKDYLFASKKKGRRSLGGRFKRLFGFLLEGFEDRQEAGFVREA
jgi:hypothetical protein